MHAILYIYIYIYNNIIYILFFLQYFPPIYLFIIEALRYLHISGEMSDILLDAGKDLDAESFFG